MPPLNAAAERLVGEANAGTILQKVYIEGLPPAPQVNLMIDREKAGAFGVTFEDINNTISTNLGSNYVNDFPNRGRMQRVIVQADRGSRHERQRDPQLQRQEQPRPIGAVLRLCLGRVVQGPDADRGFQLSIRRCASAAKPGPAIPPATPSPRWSGWPASCRAASATNGPGSRCRRSCRARRRRSCSALSALVVFLCLAALYESWTIPLAVLLTVPLGILGAVLAAMLRGLPNDVYFTVGLITIIGLAAKDAILIIEFAKDLRAQGKPLIEATMEACTLRFRPILMTGLAFVCGVLPMVVAHGAGGASQQALGTGVMGGMIAVVVLALLMVPVFFVVVQRWLARDREGGDNAGNGRAVWTAGASQPRSLIFQGSAESISRRGPIRHAATTSTRWNSG